MTKSTITRERLLEIIVTGPDASGAEQNLLARMALAAMDSEPVAWTTGSYSQNIGCNFGEKAPGEAPCIASVYWDINIFRMYTDCDATASRWLEEAVKNTGAKPLYTHPAPSIPAAVPDEIEPTIEAIKRILPTANPDEYAACIGADMWNACRAAMLNGGKP